MGHSRGARRAETKRTGLALADPTSHAAHALARNARTGLRTDVVPIFRKSSTPPAAPRVNPGASGDACGPRRRRRQHALPVLGIAPSQRRPLQHLFQAAVLQNRPRTPAPRVEAFTASRRPSGFKRPAILAVLLAVREAAVLPRFGSA